jgi:hypothetical protein
MYYRVLSRAPPLMAGCKSILWPHLRLVFECYAPLVEYYGVPTPQSSGAKPPPLGSTHVIRKPSLTDRRYVPTASNNENKGLGRGWSGLFAFTCRICRFYALLFGRRNAASFKIGLHLRPRVSYDHPLNRRALDMALGVDMTPLV